MEFILNATLLLTGLVSAARKLFINVANELIDRNAMDTTPEDLPKEFFYFMVEYAFAAVEENIKNGTLPEDTFLNVKTLSEALTKEEMEFAVGFHTNPEEIGLKIVEGLDKRALLLDKMPWFSQILPRLRWLSEHASETII